MTDASPISSDARPPGEDPLIRGEELIEHADRIWQAEREVADRFATRVRQIVVVATTLLGGVFVAALVVVRSAAEGVSGWLTVLASVALVVGLGWQWWHLLRVPRILLVSERWPDEAAHSMMKARKAHAKSENEPRMPTASYHLDLPDETLDWYFEHADTTRFAVAMQLLKASKDLRQRNLRQQHRIKAGELALSAGLWATLWLGIAIVVIYGVFLWVGANP